MNTTLVISGQTVTTVRIFYAKTARARYISHLDTMRTITRALRRSRLPLWHTEGFNPHLYITFALPISLGYEGMEESFDIRLTEDVTMDKLAATIGSVLPTGFTVLRAALPEWEAKDIAWADYNIRLLYGPEDKERIWQSFANFNAQPAITVDKKSKKGIQQVDIRPLVQNLAAEATQEALVMTLRAAAGNSVNINPTLYLKAFYDWAGWEPEGVRVARTAILTEDFENFR